MKQFLTAQAHSILAIDFVHKVHDDFESIEAGRPAPRTSW